MGATERTKFPQGFSIIFIISSRHRTLESCKVQSRTFPGRLLIFIAIPFIENSLNVDRKKPIKFYEMTFSVDVMKWPISWGLKVQILMDNACREGPLKPVIKSETFSPRENQFKHRFAQHCRGSSPPESAGPWPNLSKICTARRLIELIQIRARRDLLGGHNL